MIQHVYEQAGLSAVTEVSVATDDQRIKQAVEGFGGRRRMVDRRLSDRNGSGCRGRAHAGGDYFVDLQGDEIPCIRIY